MGLKVKDWQKLQHYRDRKPPWIRLYRDCIDSPDWYELDGDAAKILIGLWCLAAEDERLEGNLPDLRHIAFRLRISEGVAREVLKKLKPWLDEVASDTLADCYQPASNLLAECYQPATTETEANTETNTEMEAEAIGTLSVGATEASSRSLRPSQPPDGVSETVWRDFLALRKANKSPLTESALNGIRREADMAGWSLQRALEECCVRGWKSFKAGWIEEKRSASETRQSTVNGLTRGCAIPSSTKTFRASPITFTGECRDVEGE